MKRARSPEDSDSSPQPSEKKPKKSKKQSTLSSLIMSTSEAEASKSWKQTSFPSSTIKILSWNINGIRAVLKKKDLQKLIAKEDPTILCLNETKIDSEKLEQEGIKHLFPKHYLQYWNCVKPPKKGYAGTAIFSKVRPLSVQYDIGVQQHDLEGRTITLQFKSFYLVACYVPNAGQKLDRLGYRVKKWDADFQNYIQNLEKTGKPVILCGDLNVAHHEIDISNPKGNTRSAGFTVEERAEFTKFLKKGFTDTFRKLYPKTVKYSYWSQRGTARAENKGWRLDYFVVSNSMFPAVVDSEILNEYMGSDHCPLALTFNENKISISEEQPTQEEIKEEVKEEVKGEVEKDEEEEDKHEKEDKEEQKVVKKSKKKIGKKSIVKKSVAKAEEIVVEEEEADEGESKSGRKPKRKNTKKASTRSISKTPKKK